MKKTLYGIYLSSCAIFGLAAAIGLVETYWGGLPLGAFLVLSYEDWKRF